MTLPSVPVIVDPDIGPAVDVGGGHLLPEYCRALYRRAATGPDGTVTDPADLAPGNTTGVEVVCQLHDGELVVTEVTLRGTPTKPVTATDFRSVRFQDVVNAVKEQAAATVAFQRTGRRLTTPERVALYAKVSGQRRIDRQLLEDVATVARQHPLEPTKQVAEQLHTSRRNAARWIAEARRRGILEEAQR